MFDTAFHQTIPPKAHTYAIPKRLARKHRIRRYGFHGPSHKYVAHKATELMDKKLRDCKIITCHLGNGCSIAALRDGRCVDTSMGFTPLEGVIMGTRCGDLDPAVVLHLMDRLGMTLDKVRDLLNKKSGMLGLTGLSHDMREIEEEAQKGNEQAVLALDIYSRRIVKYIGAYAAEMGGVDAIVFTVNIGEKFLNPVI